MNKCISLMQPWATLWVAGVKIHETRSSPTDHRGTLIVHAAKHRARGCRELCDQYPFKDELAKLGYTYDTLPFGAVVGAVDIVDCVEAWTVHGSWDESERSTEDDLDCCFNTYGLGRFAWLAERHMMLAEPIPYSGQPDIFDIPGCEEVKHHA